jgi:hypothetical protein
MIQGDVEPEPLHDESSRYDHHQVGGGVSERLLDIIQCGFMSVSLEPRRKHQNALT